MMTEGKVWGTTAEVYQDGNISVHHLKAKAGGFCSEHRHAFKDNIFVVLEGELRVGIERGGGMIDQTTLHSGDSITVPAGTWHTFLAVRNSVFIEIYRAGLREPDIERRTQGGCNPDAVRSGD
jgi:quercetin dioxygenase-like cupin family protein